MLPECIAVKLTTQDLNFVVSKPEQAHERLVDCLPVLQRAMCYLLLHLNSQYPASCTIERGLQQDMLLLRE